MKKSQDHLNEVFEQGGLLARQIQGYRPRKAQLNMAQAVSQAIQKQHHLIAEAGTGTGKTFAYLVPAILSGRQIVIATATRNLQDQLYHQDLPVLRKALGMPFKSVLLKGRSNYLCTYRMEDAAGSGRLTANDHHNLEKIRAWSGRTRSGDIAEVDNVPEAASIWPLVTSTVDNCLGTECADYADCFLVQARRTAQEAEIIIVNHHLLCADWSLKKGGSFGELLPDAEVVIVDEAHQLVETASQFLGTSLSVRQLNELAADVMGECLKEAADMPRLRSEAEQLQQSVEAFRLAFGEDLGRGSWEAVIQFPYTLRTLDELIEQLEVLAKVLEQAASRSTGLDACWKRCLGLHQKLAAMNDEDSDDWVRWFEVYRHSVTLSRTPVDVAPEFQRLIQEQPTSWILTSATLTVADSFEHFAARLGLEDAATGQWDSPFDYAAQALFYHPQHMPDPGDPDFIPALIDMAVPVLQASQGRAFLLFTSHRALQQAAELLETRLDYPLLVQGSLPKPTLIERFKQHGHAILLGTASFWEGVDVRGSALSCVIIDKLPFASPGDPVLKARLDHIKAQGASPFMTHQVPAAVIALKQGAGRLIRDVQDRGVFVLCDPRLLKRSYGHQFLDSLPAMRRTRAIEDVQAFFDSNPEQTET